MLFRHSRPSFLLASGYCGTWVLLQPCPHATRYQSLLCCFAPTGQFLCLLSFIPALLVVVDVVVRRNLKKLVRLCFWRARCVYRTMRVYKPSVCLRDRIVSCVQTHHAMAGMRGQEARLYHGRPPWHYSIHTLAQYDEKNIPNRDGRSVVFWIHARTNASMASSSSQTFAVVHVSDQ